MAGQGTYMAYQPLKPTELKVGDYFNSFVDDYLKRNDAKQVAEAKRLADQKKGIDVSNRSNKHQSLFILFFLFIITQNFDLALF